MRGATMPEEKLSDLQPGPASQRSRWELRTLLIVVVAVIVIGGIYVALFGSPTRNRAAVDSGNSRVGGMGQPSRPTVPTNRPVTTPGR